MKRYVIDTGILFLYFISDKRIQPYFDEIIKGRARAFICDINLAEYYYKVCEKIGKDIAEIRYYQIRYSPIEVVPTDEELTRMAGEKKCKYRGKFSLADCFVLALAEAKKAILLTTDSRFIQIEEVKVKYFSVK